MNTFSERWLRVLSAIDDRYYSVEAPHVLTLLLIGSLATFLLAVVLALLL